MFQFLFKYPRHVFEGPVRFARPVAEVGAPFGGVGGGCRARMADTFAIAGAAPKLRSWRAGIIWLLQAALATLVLILLWQPAITVAQLKPQQNIIALLVDDSRSMSLANGGATRAGAGRESFARRRAREVAREISNADLYSVDSHLTRVSSLKELQPSAPATHIGDSRNNLRRRLPTCPLARLCC